jgi:hypothetical protein
MFTGSKVKKLLEDESLRELVCAKLNLGLEVKYAEDEFIQDVVSKLNFLINFHIRGKIY